MISYTPKLWHTVLLFILSGIFFVYEEWVFFIGFIILTIISLVFLTMDVVNERYRTLTAFINRLQYLSPQQFNALGIAYPSLHIKWQGKPITYIDNTGIRKEDFERFMEESNHYQISPERNWKGTDLLTWQMIKDWLEAGRFIYPNSASGNHSWLWRGNSYEVIRGAYLGPQELPEAVEIPSPTPSIYDIK